MVIIIVIVQVLHSHHQQREHQYHTSPCSIISIPTNSRFTSIYNHNLVKIKLNQISRGRERDIGRSMQCLNLGIQNNFPTFSLQIYFKILILKSLSRGREAEVQQWQKETSDDLCSEGLDQDSWSQFVIFSSSKVPNIKHKFHQNYL